MPLSPGLSPRKVPRQERSREMVERIIAAAEQVLSEHGYDGASTNRIARTAGISSGSLYQYFPNKDAIVIEVLNRFVDELSRRFTAELEAVVEVPWRVGLRQLLDAQLAALEEHVDLLRIIVEQVPRFGVVDKLASFQQRLADLSRNYLYLNRNRLRPDLDLGSAVWIMVEVTGQLPIRYVLNQPAISRERMLDELTSLVVRYVGRAGKNRS